MKSLKKGIPIALLFFIPFVLSHCRSAGDQQKEVAAEADKKTYQVIHLHYIGGITPAEVTVTPGTTMIWMNNSRAPLELQFEGKQVTLACKSPVHFVIDENGSFLSERIPHGSVASLCFVEKGEFTYVARKVFAGTGVPDREKIKEFKGTVIVK